MVSMLLRVILCIFVFLLSSAAMANLNWQANQLQFQICPNAAGLITQVLGGFPRSVRQVEKS